jgi:hypothetical protein
MRLTPRAGVALVRGRFQLNFEDLALVQVQEWINTRRISAFGEHSASLQNCADAIPTGLAAPSRQAAVGGCALRRSPPHLVLRIVFRDAQARILLIHSFDGGSFVSALRRKETDA